MKLYELSEEISELYRRIRHGVVRVQQTTDEGEVVSEATGTLWTQQGIVLTVSHLFDDADRIRVIHGGDLSVSARVRGWDNRYNLAVLEVEGTTVSPWQDWGELEDLAPGEIVFTLGYGEIRWGMVSFTAEKTLNRWGGTLKPWVEVDGMLRATQAGGALVNSIGRYVGINSPVPGPSGQVLGYGQLQNLVQEILVRGNPKPAYLGVRTARAQTREGRSGVVITHVDPDSPAEQSGLQTGDVILEVNGAPVTSPRQLFMTLRTMSTADTVSTLIDRGGAETTVTVTLG